MLDLLIHFISVEFKYLKVFSIRICARVMHFKLVLLLGKSRTVVHGGEILKTASVFLCLRNWMEFLDEATKSCPVYLLQISWVEFRFP